MGIGPISVARARELLGESFLDIVLTKGVEVATIAPAGRGWTAYQRLALLWNRPMCAVNGCTCPRVEIDHRQAWTDNGPTIIANADPHCRWHHHLKTHKGYALVGERGNQRMVAPDHPNHPNNTS
jgi:hypothetical protein